MRLRSWMMLWLCTSACAGGDERAPDAAADGGELGVTLTAFVSQWDNVKPLAGVEVCQGDSKPCAISNAQGMFALSGLVPDREILLVYRKDGYISMLQPMVSPLWSTYMNQEVPMMRADLRGSPDQQNALLRGAGLPAWDDFEQTQAARADIFFSADSNLATGLASDVQVDLDPASGFGPLFVLSDGMALDVPVGRTAGSAYFMGVEPRDDGYELVYTHAHGACTQRSGVLGGWPARSGRPNATRVPARADFFTWITSELCIADASEVP